MSTPIDNVKSQIEALQKQREDLYKQFTDIEKQLKAKQLILDAFLLVSSDVDLYNSWKTQIDVTPVPVVKVAEESVPKE